MHANIYSFACIFVGAWLSVCVSLCVYVCVFCICSVVSVFSCVHMYSLFVLQLSVAPVYI